ncbi:hypothetical protein [Variovorax sp. DXTD-1]|uniref:hypothetical protein n=1 Tax=Variovorax sp. DXTD-1 TaxID=2495592 RepID=UPI000F870363|nr:hypothetical protein [Variovorax sp. DXTD-1]RST54116.1 hypothetical protein EJI00_03035 [Variovorax sp. DXTD-1]
MNSLILTRPDAPVKRVSLTTDRVLQLIAEIHAAGRAASRQTVADLLEVPVGKVDEHTKKLIESGAIRRVMPGVFEPVESMPPARAVSVTRIQGGWVKIEVGDDMLTITLEEERMLAMSVKGAAEQFHAMVTGRDLADQIADLRRRDHEQAERAATDKARISALEEQLRVFMSVPKQLRIDDPR